METLAVYWPFVRGIHRFSAQKGSNLALCFILCCKPAEQTVEELLIWDTMMLIEPQWNVLEAGSWLFQHQQKPIDFLTLKNTRFNEPLF